MSIATNQIPEELASLKQWVAWNLETRKGSDKPTKVPYRIDRSKSKAQSTNPQHWGCMTQALQRMKDDNLTGIGFVFNGQGILGIDLDDCITDGVVADWAQEIVDTMASYTEITPSGKGLHILLKAKLEGRGRRKGKLEVYCNERYFTVTGNRLDGCVDYLTSPEGFSDWFEDKFNRQESTSVARPSTPAPIGDDSDLIIQATTSANGDKFGRLWQGNTADYDGDHSRADQALCMMLAFWTGGDASRIDQLFRKSGLIRKKWDDKHGAQTYGRMTIDYAIEHTSAFYEPEAYDDDVVFETALDRLHGNIEKQVAPKAPTARPVLTNVIMRKEKKSSEKKAFYCQPNVMLATLIEGTNGWPKRIGGVLFALAEGYDEELVASSDDIVYLKSQDEFYAWCQKNIGLAFTAKKTVLHEMRSVNPVTRGEFYRIVQQGVEQFDSIELLPHTPKIKGSFYFPTALPKPTGNAVNELLAVLNAETEVDRALMLAALLTPGWGGPPGARPAFVFTSEHGRGSGKTMTADFFAQVWGGCLTVQESEPLEGVRARLLDESSLSTRIVLIDNLKARLSNGSIESMITASAIDGKRMYVGQASRPNYLTWYITSNNPDLSRDLAERSIQIKVGQPKHDIDFRSWSIKFLAENRLQLLADLLGLLQSPTQHQVGKENADRWLTWQTQVLSKIPNANELAKISAQTREEMDSDVGTAGEIEQAIQKFIRLKSCLVTDCLLLVPKDIHEAFVKEGLRKKTDRQQTTTSYIKHYLDVPPLRGVLSFKAVKRNGSSIRYFLWRGNDKTPDTYATWPLVGQTEEQELEY